MYRRLIASCFALNLCLVLMTSFAQEELNVLTWCDNTDPSLLQPFEEEYGVRVNAKEYDGMGTALALVEQSRPGDWDVFVVDTVEIPRLVEMGLLAPLNEADYPWDDFFPEVQLRDLHFQNGQLYAVPEKFGYNTIAFNNENASLEDMRDLNMLWDEKYKGQIALYDYYIPMIGLTALSLGIKPNEVTAENLPQIKEKLFALKDNSALVGDTVTVITAIATGEVNIVAGGGEYAVSNLSQENPALDWVLPEQGGLRWQQAIGVFADSEKKDLATKFVQYIVSPEGQARLATSECYWAMPANSKAPLTDEQKAILRWDEQPAFLQNSYLYFIPDAELDALMLDMWTEVLQH
jgi:spermidine/putrescine transport system substrate-binding protein